MCACAFGALAAALAAGSAAARGGDAEAGAAPSSVERGPASWYGERFHGRLTASGERFDMHALTAAHPTLPMRSLVRVRNPATGQSVVVRINDRGPFHGNRIIDLSRAAAARLGVLGGVATVVIERLGQVGRAAAVMVGLQPPADDAEDGPADAAAAAGPR